MYLNLISATQIITESLPISSSTHVKIVELLCVYFGYSVQTLPTCFDYLLHGPTLLILTIFFRHAWFTPLKLLLSFKKSNLNIIAKIFWYAIIATIPPAIFMFGVIKPWLKHTNVYNSTGLLITGLIVTMCMLLSLRLSTKAWILNQVQDDKSLTTRKVIILGLVQALALLPGISRFASTYVVGRWLGLSPRRSFESSFLIGAPLFIGAFLLGILEFIHLPSWQTLIPSLITIIGATVAGYLSLWFMWRLAQRNLLWTIGWYLPFPTAIILFTYFY